MAGQGDLPTVVLQSNDGSVAEIYLHGGHVASWRPAPELEERLFLSSRSAFHDGAAIRGGIPVIFPQFAMEGPLPRHGFARTRTWTLSSLDSSDDGSAVATFVNVDDAATRAVWPHEFLLTLAVHVGGPRLAVALSVENTGQSSFSFAAALHTYIRVRDIARAELVGLHGAAYRVSGQEGLTFDTEEVLHVRGEIDRVYARAPNRLLLRDADRALRIETSEFPDVVVWNPGARAAASLSDMEQGGEQSFLCVEAAAVNTPILLDPRQRWVGMQTLVTSTLGTP